ncbi:F137 protein [Hirschfeldia incana]|nr:F137 protein [Hirschfeldia incana]
MDSSSSSFSAFTELPSSIVGVTREEFHAFHRIDRILFTRLVFDLNRDTNQTSYVIAFLFLLEQIEFARQLTPFLVGLSDAFIETVANEVDVCLSILRNLDYSTLFVANNDDGSVIPFLLRLTGGRLTLRYVHQNREILLLGVRKNMNEICSRAFDDLCVEAERYYREQLLALQREKIIEEMSNMRLSVQQGSPNRLNLPQGISSTLSVQQQNPIRTSVPQGILNRQSVQQGIPFRRSVQQGILTRQSVQYQTPIRLGAQQERAPALTTPLPVEEDTNRTATEEVENEEGVIPADDRTVFLTFSKGYPTSESEVKVYFTRRFGEVIEAILMQDVEENEQPLFARMVLRMECASIIEEIVGPANKKKYTLDGKHVWARKYVRKKPSSTATPSSSHV